MKNDLTNKIITLTQDLKLSEFRKFYKEEIKKAKTEQSSYEEFLYSLLKMEHEKRLDNRKKANIKRSNFPYKKYLCDLKKEELPIEAQDKLKYLKTLEFIKEGQNIILSGNAGTGKTHIAIGIGMEACMRGYKVLFTTVHSLITRLKESKTERTLLTIEKQFEKYDLVICDEFGYISFDKEGSELLFTHLSLRANRKSIIVTTNLTFERWEEIFGDPILTAAMVDRLTHKAYLINMNGDSYRIKETKEWLNKKV